MDIAQALDLANAQILPGFITSDAELTAERQKTEDAIKSLMFAWSDGSLTSFDPVRALADTNRQLVDAYGVERLERMPAVALSRGLSAQDHLRAVATLQGKSLKTVTKVAREDAEDLGAALVSAPVGGTIMGIDIETTDKDPARGYIVNLGLEFWNVGPKTAAVEPLSAYFGLPDIYEQKGVPLERVHHITWENVCNEEPFRLNTKIQQALLTAMKKVPFMAHNASFEDSWFMLHLEGYAEARAAGEIVVIDSREICRRIDPEYKSLPHDSHPAALESWARRRGTLLADEAEKHLGLEDVDLMIRTVQAEFIERNMFV